MGGVRILIPIGLGCSPLSLVLISVLVADGDVRDGDIPCRTFKKIMKME